MKYIITESELVKLVKRAIKEQSGNEDLKTEHERNMRDLEFFKELIDHISDVNDWDEMNIPSEKIPPNIFDNVLKYVYSHGKLTDDEIEELHDYTNKAYSKLIRNDSVKHFTPDEAYFFRIVKPKLMQNGFVQSEGATNDRFNRKFELVYGEYPNDVHIRWIWDFPEKDYMVYIGFFKKVKHFILSNNSSENESVANNAVKYALSLKK